eukprot:TRINITY_DN3447_c0_g1_i2.p1 TRINITY_DN3447_c0_g1~~TRINITY_DN3447_c0_g1_i2.p1  ORF type:complete len:1213 (-),score=496.58 TRINITY_DN3447_c0_g1_i2:42-3680(-)
MEEIKEEDEISVVSTPISDSEQDLNDSSLESSNSIEKTEETVEDTEKIEEEEEKPTEKVEQVEKLEEKPKSEEKSEENFENEVENPSPPLLPSDLRENYGQCLVSYSEENSGIWKKWVEKGIVSMTPFSISIDEPKWSGKAEFEFVPSQEVWTAERSKENSVESLSDLKNWYLKPHVHLFLIQTEDLEVWNNVLKAKLKQWTNEMNQKKVEWLIVHVCTNQKTAASQIASKFVGSVYQKIRGEYPIVEKRDRCIQIRPLEKDNKQWEDLLSKLREFVVFGFLKTISTYEDECRRLSADRMKSDWDLYSFFLMKEGLAFTFQKMGMLQKAWLQYYELDAAFSDPNVRERFATFGAEDGDEEGNIFDLERKPFRKLILDKKLSEFELRQIIFARQTYLLLAQARHSRVAKRAMDFFQRMNCLLSIHKSNSDFGFAWIFNSCLQVAHHCEGGFSLLSGLNSSLGDENLNSSQERSSVRVENPEEERRRLHLLIGDLYFMARRCLDRLYSLPSSSTLKAYHSVSFLESDSSPSSFKNLVNSPQNSNKFPANSKLGRILQSQKSFDKEYLSITKKAEEHYKHQSNEQGGQSRKKSILKLREDVATIDFARGRYENASAEFLRLYECYEKEGWHSLSYNLICKASICYLLLHSKEKYLHACFLKLQPSLSLCMDLKQRKFYQQEIESLMSSSSSFLVEQNVSPVIDHELILNEFKKKEIEVTSGSLLTFHCNFFSHLPEDIKFDEIFLLISPKDGIATPENKIRMKSLDQLNIPSNRVQSITFQHEMITKGSFVIESINLKKGKVSLSEHIFKEHSSRVIKVIGSKPTARIRAKKASGILIWSNVQLLHVTVDTGLDDVTLGNIKVTADPKSPTLVTFPEMNEIDIRVNDIQKKEEKQSRVSVRNTEKERHIPLPSPLKESTVEFFIPILGHYQPRNPQHNRSSIRFDLTYRKHTKEDFLITVELPVEFDFPFEISYHVVALEKKVFLQILMQSMVSSSTKIRQYSLTLPTGFTMSNSFTVGEIVIGPRELASLLFELNLDPQIVLTKEEHPFEIKTQYSLLEPQSHPLLIDHPLLNNDFRFQKEVPVQIPKVFYQIETKFPEETTVGSFLPVHFEISCFSPLSESLQYEIAVDRSVWMLSGKKSLSFSLKEGEKKEFFCRLLPITSGFLPLPKISLRDLKGKQIEDRHILVSNEHVQCRVGSPATFVSALVEAKLTQ